MSQKHGNSDWNLALDVHRGIKPNWYSCVIEKPDRATSHHDSVGFTHTNSSSLTILFEGHLVAFILHCLIKSLSFNWIEYINEI